MTKRTGGLEINEDLQFQRREWRVQRIGWWLLTAFVAAAALGLFGGGVLSQAVAGDANGPLRVEYERFLRAGTRQRLSIQVRRASAAAGEELQLQINRAYFEAMRVEDIAPQPLSMAVDGENVTLRFGPASEQFTIIVDAQPLEPGRLWAVLRLGVSTVTFNQFAYF